MYQPDHLFVGGEHQWKHSLSAAFSFTICSIELFDIANHLFVGGGCEFVRLKCSMYQPDHLFVD